MNEKLWMYYFVILMNMYSVRVEINTIISLIIKTIFFTEIAKVPQGQVLLSTL